MADENPIPKKVILAILLFVTLTTLYANYHILQSLHVKSRESKIKASFSGAATGILSMCVNKGSPSLNETIPKQSDILNGTQTVQSRLNSSMGFTSFNISFYYVNNSETTFIEDDTTFDDLVFSTAWNTQTVTDQNCLYRLQAQAQSSQTPCENFDTITSGIFTVDNVFTAPIWDTFMNNITTNFTQLTRFSNLSDIIVGNAHGLINFSGSGWNLDDLNLTTSIVIADSTINISFTHNCFSSFSLNITMKNMSLSDAAILRNGVACSTCSDPVIQGTDVYFVITENGDYSVTGDQTSSLIVFDETDPEGGNITMYRADDVTFYANYTDSTNNPITGDSISCSIDYNDTQPASMSFTTDNRYEYIRSFGAKGNYSYSVECNGTSLGYRNQNGTGNVIISNSPPEFIENISGFVWNEDTVLTGLNLHDHFTDDDEDDLEFTPSEVLNMIIVIDSDGIVSFIPDSNWFGLRAVSFTANDSEAVATSNNFTLTVRDVAESGSGSSTPSTGGGGGGGGGGGLRGFACIAEWYCEPYGLCVDGIRERTCYDLNNCEDETEKPLEQEECIYEDSCFDGVQNQEEEGIDCGGPCPACFTCFDRRINQDETDIDCGGSNCDPCIEGDDCKQDIDCESGYCNPNNICSTPTCSDGWKNQGEEEVDCGGPCSPCPQLQQPTPFQEDLQRIVSPPVLVAVIGGLAALTAANMFRKPLLKLMWMLLYKLYPVRHNLTIDKYNTILQQFNQKLLVLEKTLKTTEPRPVLDKLIVDVRTLFVQIFELKKSFNLQELNQRIKKGPLPLKARKMLFMYYTTILRYQDPRLQKTHVSYFIDHGKKIVDLLKKQRP